MRASTVTFFVMAIEDNAEIELIPAATNLSGSLALREIITGSIRLDPITGIMIDREPLSTTSVRNDLKTGDHYNDDP